MKKLCSILLAICMMAGLIGLVSAAAVEVDPYDSSTWPELVLNQAMDFEMGYDDIDGQVYYGWGIFRPVETGWYVFEILGPQKATFDFRLMRMIGPQGRRTGSEFRFMLCNNDYNLVNAIASDRCIIAYLEIGTEYVASAQQTNFFTETCQLLVKKESISGEVKVQTNDITIYVGQIALWHVFPVWPWPSYHILRVESLGDAVNQYLVAKNPGISTLVFYDMADNEVGRCTVTVTPAPWWQSLSPFLQLLLRWFAFGWLWMT